MAFAQWWRNRAAQLRIDSMAGLLLALGLNVFVVPFAFAHDSAITRVARDVLLSLTLLSGIAAVSNHRGQRVIVALVAGVAILFLGTGWFLPPAWTPGLRDETALLAQGVLGAVIGINVFAPGRVTFDRILGAIALYVLIGVVWAEAYQLVGIHIPDAYAGIHQVDARPDRATWVYFSFVTLTTVGYGDITPIAHAARSLSILEALIGQLYPAIVLARLVSLHVAADGSGDSPVE
ncbi:potassium channel family protein [Paraburkholderia sp. GAS334]|uniref:potassium channel family protein n=1 Tax=Paraburkholderia sp. GAS334 TaxID=3035131 RepID=UPI003D191C38